MSSPEIEESKGELQLEISKLMEEKHIYKYSKLVVPSSMRSIYWRFFGFPATESGKILTKVKIVCTICHTQIAYNRNTSNLRMHLQNKHNQTLIELETNKPPKKQYVPHSIKEKRVIKKSKNNITNSNSHIYATSIDESVHIDDDIEFVTDSNVNLSNLEEDIIIESPIIVPRKRASSTKDYQVSYVQPDDNTIQTVPTDEKTVSDAITEFIIIDLQLPEIVEGRGFQRLIATLKSPCEIPSKNKLDDEIIPKVYENFRETVMESISCITSEFGLAFDEWKSNSNETFMTVSIYYQNPGESTLETKILNTFHTPMSWSENQWGLAIDSLFSEWELNCEKITAVVVASVRNELLTALSNRGLTIVPCLLHTLQLCAQSCFENVDVAIILNKCRAIIGAISKSNTLSESIPMQEPLLEIDENPIVMDCPSIWISTYNMIDQMVLRRNIISVMLETIDGIDQDAIELSDDQWKIMEDLVRVLEPFKVTILTLSEEKMPIISLLKPLLWQLVSSHMKPKDTESDLARSLKESLSEMLIDRYADSNVALLLQIATTLDPRFKQLPYATEEDKNMASKPIKEMLVKLIEDEGEHQVNDDNIAELTHKKSRLSGMAMLLGNYCTTKNRIPSEERADLELIQYQAEPTAPLHYCPLQWWTKITAKCPNLSKLARRYNCVPACCAPPSRIPSEMQILYDSRRAALPPHLIDKLLFLHGNHIV
ncbi:hypothetical protein PV327_000277 [Microctonus hyperodae]|uniref:BED-type domain-containing protein n=1 Tax=Microctonus hyperodae TaxID=165561 RepID=A0AA39L1T5_MICHY|nr:hypothetical protein PV327_000277 [Microctonus hyperodae]